MAYALIPDVARIVSAFLRADPEVVALIDQRVFTVFPKQVGGQPFVLVQRVGGNPVVIRPRSVELAVIQLDVYGGVQRAAWEISETCLSALVTMRGEQPSEAGNVCDVRPTATLRWQPDETFNPPRPRYVSDLEVTVKPAGVVLARAS